MFRHDKLGVVSLVDSSVVIAPLFSLSLEVYKSIYHDYLFLGVMGELYPELKVSYIGTLI